jgi:outer membrane protein assembly factor BamA
MQNFRSIRISYATMGNRQGENASDSGWLACNILLSPLEKHTLNFELLGKDIGSDYGIGVNLNLKNRNLFHGGEVQYDNLLFSTEFQRNTTIEEANEEVPMWRYRNFELGGEIGIHFPKMIFPFSQSLIPKKFHSQTRISAGSYFQQRDHYSRLITNTGVEYEWKPSDHASHILKLTDISMVKIYKDSIFDHNLANYSQRIREKYTSHVLIGTNYKLLYNNISNNKRQNFYRMRLNLNAYGNLLYGLFSLSGAQKDSKGQYTIAGTPFTSFVSAEIDFTYNLMLWERSSLVAHTCAGLGTPTSNASTLPFERSFYLGGTNSMRAWNLRELGPGSYHGTLSNFESSGDIKWECNLEFRTPVYKKIFTALFLDLGNIWNIRKNVEIPNGEFAWNRFYKELALDGGVGVRLDLSFLVLRMDVAATLRTPYLDESERWRKHPVTWDELHFRFGIGYPF